MVLHHAERIELTFILEAYTVVTDRHTHVETGCVTSEGTIGGVSGQLHCKNR